MAFDAGGKVTAMDHHASAGWPTLVIIPGGMVDGLYGKKYDPFAIAGADHWYDVGAQRVRALSTISPIPLLARLAALGRARLD